MEKKLQIAIQNVTNIIVNTPLKAQEHAQLQNDLALIRQRCVRADELEKKFAKELKAEQKGKK